MTGAEVDVLLHVLAEDRLGRLLHERFTHPEPRQRLIESGLLRHPIGSPFLMLTEAGRAAAEALT